MPLLFLFSDVLMYIQNKSVKHNYMWPSFRSCLLTIFFLEVERASQYGPQITEQINLYLWMFLCWPRFNSPFNNKVLPTLDFICYLFNLFVLFCFLFFVFNYYYLLLPCWLTLTYELLFRLHRCVKKQYGFSIVSFWRKRVSDDVIVINKFIYIYIYISTLI